MKGFRRWLCALTAAVMLTGCAAGFAENTEQSGLSDETASITEGIRRLTGKDVRVITHEGQVTQIEGSCSDSPIRSLEDAAVLVSLLASGLSENPGVEFIPLREFADAVGNRYYVFQQIAAGTTVCGGAVKVITDPEGNMLGMSCSTITDLPAEKAGEGITAREAEEIVNAFTAAQGQPEMTVLEGFTEKIILPLITEFDSDVEEESSRYVWVAYTLNPSASVSRGSDLPYLAFYVTMDGEILYALPTLFPGDETAKSGFDSSYVFEFMEPVEYTGYVDMADGTEKELTVTVMRDRRTGMYYLGNIERRIVVADCWPFMYNHGMVALESSRDNLEWDQNALKSFYTYCRVWDYYRELGWTGANGRGTPMLILNDFCDENGMPVDNAAYIGDYLGWSIFAASRANSFAECIDVIAHEFTHCVTNATTTYNAYLNDYGAINEAISDIQGQICERILEEDIDPDWLIGEDSGMAIRSMMYPHAFQQPEYTWDLYYQPNVLIPTSLNDRGGVHGNSALLNRIAAVLIEEGGMTAEDARVFWFAVDCAMVPGTDHAQLRELMPWVLKTQGMDRYTDTLMRIIEETRLGDDTLAEQIPSDHSQIVLALPDEEKFLDGNWALQIYAVDLDNVYAWLQSVYSQMKNGNTADLPVLLQHGAEEFEKMISDEKAENFTLGGMLYMFLDFVYGEKKEGGPSLNNILSETVTDLLAGAFLGGSDETSGPGAAGLLSGLLGGLTDETAGGETESGAAAETGEEDPTLNGLSDLIFGPETPADGMTPEEEAYAEQVTELREWLFRGVNERFFQAMTAAGQDGRTIRMVSIPGRTVPILLHMAFNEDTQSIEQYGVAVLVHGKWYSMTGLFSALPALENQEGQPEEESGAAAGILEDDSLQSMLIDLGLAFFTRGKDQSLLDLFTTNLKAGEVTVLPETGLTNIQLSDHNVDLMEDLFGEEEGEDEVREHKMSRPKIEEEDIPTENPAETPTETETPEQSEAPAA